MEFRELNYYSFGKFRGKISITKTVLKRDYAVQTLCLDIEGLRCLKK